MRLIKVKEPTARFHPAGDIVKGVVNIGGVNISVSHCKIDCTISSPFYHKSLNTYLNNMKNGSSTAVISQLKLGLKRNESKKNCDNQLPCELIILILRLHYLLYLISTGCPPC